MYFRVTKQLPNKFICPRAKYQCWSATQSLREQITKGDSVNFRGSLDTVPFFTREYVFYLFTPHIQPSLHSNRDDSKPDPNASTSLSSSFAKSSSNYHYISRRRRKIKIRSMGCDKMLNRGEERILIYNKFLIRTLQIFNLHCTKSAHNWMPILLFSIQYNLQNHDSMSDFNCAESWSYLDWIPSILESFLWTQRVSPTDHDR